MNDTLPQAPHTDNGKQRKPKQRRIVGMLFGKPIYEADESGDNQAGRILEIYPPVYMALRHQNAHWDETNQCYILTDIDE